MSQSKPFPTVASYKWKHFRPEVILLSVRWYLRYPLSYRQVEEMMIERGWPVDHSTINRWVLQFGARNGQAPSASSAPDQRLLEGG